ncbi:right-handed parallel beta-helix repeat-containing protein [Fulvivirga sp. M361]|uniref:right-handed parallel beta-helix repeat-containing protein n=1 Tax=Fulvivirga sp. M361 TaxID=2594266 RepID=UPI00117A723D|nr:right-handed parallel beta-helix repeat-containing protein [Fulvivirga sp. M361]TRX61396.1 right-handed parallel beta-helix repeat-containing protein [Fulvivirga sp. M361]
MLKNLCLYLVLAIASFVACTPEAEKFTFDSEAFLRFSTDTIFYDTIFTQVAPQIKNVTKRFRVFNDNEKAVQISQIALAQGSNSAYTVFVNGRGGSLFEDVRLLGEDSLLIQVEVSIDPRDEGLPFIVEDELTFLTNGNEQKVQLVSWGQDAHFFRNAILPCNTTWTADKPYVIFNSILVDSLCTLTIEAGTQVFSHNSSFILVQGTIDVQGTADQKVTFLNDRFDDGFENAPGQWGGIVFLQGSDNNRIEHAEIRNAEVGLYLGTPDDDTDPDLIVGNTRIENIGGNTVLPIGGDFVQPGFGIIGITSDMYVYNTLINNCSENALGNYAGGNYRYEHCTFVNFGFSFLREQPTVVLANNLLLSSNTALVIDLNVVMKNTIIWGNLSEELLISENQQAAVTLDLTHNLVRGTSERLDETNILNEDPRFFDPRDFGYSLDTLSPAKDAGTDIGILFDLEGTQRDAMPDIGAFERIEN